ncbi:MAG: hypothetical protein H8K09_04595 [Nitrospira sp.]|nr:hypothetical protein [Nitrospira sp.]
MPYVMLLSCGETEVMVADYIIVGMEMSLGLSPLGKATRPVRRTETVDNVYGHEHNRRVLDGARIRARRPG